MKRILNLGSLPRIVKGDPNEVIVKSGVNNKVSTNAAIAVTLKRITV